MTGGSGQSLRKVGIWPTIQDHTTHSLRTPEPDGPLYPKPRQLTPLQVVCSEKWGESQEGRALRSQRLMSYGGCT